MVARLSCFYIQDLDAKDPFLRSVLVRRCTACAGYVQKLEVAFFLLLGKGKQMNEGKGVNRF